MYRPVEKIPDFPALERRQLDYWRERQIFARLRNRNAGGTPWSFLDGPITANNPMGVHHAWGRSYKDMFQRYHAMNGRDLRYQNGFDCQGLWVEVEVEKARGFRTKADIVEHGLAQFVRDCKERVLTFAARQTEQSIRLGYWMDWDQPETLLALRDALRDMRPEVTITTPRGDAVTGPPEQLIGRLGSAEFGGSYFTFSTENNYAIWAFLKKCHEEGFIYRGHDVMPWCCRCGTGLSQMELSEGRKIVAHTSVFVRFPLRDQPRRALLVWTTTPWTLTSNVAAAVNPGMTYLEVRHGDWVYYLGKENFERERIQELEAGGKRETHKLHTLRNILKGSGALEVVRELPGSELVGLAYDGPFDHLPAANTPQGVGHHSTNGDLAQSAAHSHRVIAWSEVSGAEGTGIVHIAPGCGAEDHRLGREQGLPVIAPLDESGHYVDGFGELSGRSVGEVTETIVTDLRERGLLVARESYPHVYPHCWRCKEELVFRLVNEWFIRMDWRDRIQRLVPQIRWIPADGEARELDWLKNMGDWMISKKRFWGLALPIWSCDDCGWFDVIGSARELEERALAGWDEFSGHTPHRPWVDSIMIRCGSCGALARRTEDVGNPWLDAGIVPFSTVHYNSNPEYWNRWFPADFVVECFPGQFRNWFYSLLAMSAMLDGRPPFRVLLGHALVRDARGEEMHKSKGNAIAFDEAAEQLGAEIMRYLYAAQNPVLNLNFPDLGARGEKGPTLDGEIRRKLLTFWNCYSFFITYARTDGWTPQDNVIPVRERSELDRWILSRLQRLIADAHESFENFSLYRFIEKLEQFNDDYFSNWYLRRSRRRFYASEMTHDKRSAYQTLYTVLVSVVRATAPILPFLTEEIFANLVRSVDARAEDSVHLTPYPRVDPDLCDSELERQIDTIIFYKNLGLSLRSQTKIKTRQPLGRMLVRPRDPVEHSVLSEPRFAQQLLEECNVKHLELINDEGTWVTTTVKPNFKSLGPRFGSRMKRIANRLADIEATSLRHQLATTGRFTLDLDGETVELGPTDVDLVHSGPENLAFVLDQGTFVALDTTLTQELEDEGIARDFNRQAQERRKEIDLQVSDRIRVSFDGSDRVVHALLAHDDYLRDELLADTIAHVPGLDQGVETKVGGETVRLEVTRAPS
ncbi:MAG: class I tRNA ligase family protein [Planctomycetota bacterium]